MNKLAPTAAQTSTSSSDDPTVNLAETRATHRVLNQPAPSAGYNAFTDDVVLREVVERDVPWTAANASALGALAGDEAVQEAARLANEPACKTRATRGR